MAKKELSITLRARNALMSGIAGARRTLMQFGGWVTGLGRRMAYAFLGAVSGLAGFVALTARAYAKQERAEKSLASVLASHGENVDALLPKLKAVAAAIQDQTGVGDEQTLQTMANLKMLGVQTDALEQAAKATIALKSAGVEEAQATKMVALATAGNYTMLSRYLHALRTATSETEKAAAVNDFLSKGYKQQCDLLNTTGGAWQALRGRVGVVLEEFGKAINKSDALTRLLHRAGDAVKRFGERITNYIESERFKQIQESVTGIIQAIGEGGDSRREVFAAFGEALKAAFALAAHEAVSVLKKAASSIGESIGNAVRGKEAILRIVSATKDALTWQYRLARWVVGSAPAPAMDSATPEADPEVEAAKERLGDALDLIYSLGRGMYTPPPPIPEITPEDFDLAGKGGGSGEAGDRTAYSGYLQNMMSRIREMGHDVEEYGARSPFDAERNQERLAVAAEEGTRLQKRTNELLEENRDLLKENLSQG
ncbi:MAG TPA: hypothetical protein PLT12_07290 [Kiritimatiellia bacterium]|nr:hypothetical protein [Kiritimatiellia bacterium]